VTIPTNIHPVGRPTAAVPPSSSSPASTSISGLPQRILPATTSFGIVTDDSGKVIGNVTIDQYWYKFLYNLGAQTLSPPATPVPTTAAELLALLDDSVPPNPKVTSVNQGAATIDFGTGASDTRIAVTGQGSIGAASKVQAWLSGLATSNNLTDAGFAEDIAVFAGDIVNGTGFTVYAFCRNGRAFGRYVVNWSWA